MTKYGMTDDHFKKVMEAEALQSIYELSDELSNFAFSISEKRGIRIEEVFSEMWHIRCNHDGISEEEIKELIVKKEKKVSGK